MQNDAITNPVKSLISRDVSISANISNIKPGFYWGGIDRKKVISLISAFIHCKLKQRWKHTRIYLIKSSTNNI